MRESGESLIRTTLGPLELVRSYVHVSAPHSRYPAVQGPTHLGSFLNTGIKLGKLYPFWVGDISNLYRLPVFSCKGRMAVLGGGVVQQVLKGLLAQ